MNLTLHHRHPWSVSPGEAIAIQRRLAPLVSQTVLTDPVRTVAGVDMSVRGKRVQAAVVVLSLPDMTVQDQTQWSGAVQFPYVPGLLSFREAPAVLEALHRLVVWPDLIMADAQGLAHPRRFGLACHLGVLLGLPALGVAKSRLTGSYDEPGDDKGAWQPLCDGDEVVGAVVRTRFRVKPVYVSVGHRMELAQAIHWTLACTTRYRLPEPTRLAHLLSKGGEIGGQSPGSDEFETEAMRRTGR